MLAVELESMATALDNIQGNQSSLASKLHQNAAVIHQAVWNNTLTTDGIFVYESNGYGGQYLMDDANVPSLVSLPYLGFLKRDDPTYLKTKNAMLSPANPYYAVGKSFEGIG